jgi:ATP-dependent exoDNAse (exonuclease V) beta subunit
LALASQLRARVLLDATTELPASLPVAERAGLMRFREQFRELRSIADRLGPAACAQAIVDGSDLVPVLAATADGEQRVANLARLIERAHAFEARGGDLRAFANWLRRAAMPGGEAEAAQAQIADEHDDVVRVMTVHQAKGLEFPVVFVPACGAKERFDYSPIVYDAEAGQTIGLSHYLVPEGQGFTHALELAAKIAGNAPVTNFAVLQALPQIAEANPSQGYLIEALMAAVASGTDEAKTRMTEFLEGRADRIRPQEGGDS